MSRLILTNTDFNKNEIQNARVQNLASAPGSPVTGQIYYDTGVNKLFWWNGSAWVDATGGAGGISSSIVDAKGDIIVGTANDTVARKAVGADNTFLVAASGQADGLQWRALASGDIGTALLQEKIATADLTDWPRSAALDLNNQKITGLADGSAATDAATFGQLSAAVQGFDWKEPVLAATTASVTLAGSAPNTVDGVTLVANARVLVKDQSSASQNGIYKVTTLGTGANGTWTRDTDADAAAELNGATVLVEQGTVNKGDIYQQTATISTLGSDTVTFTKVSEGNQTYTNGTGITLTGTTFSITAGGVTGTELAASVAGAGLTGGGGSALAVGAGTGITVGADTVSVDTAVVARKYTAAVGNGALTSITVNHALGNQWVTVQVYKNTSTFDQVECDIQLTDANNVTLIFATAPTSNQYRVVITG